MKKIILILSLFMLGNCMNYGVTADASAILELISPKNEVLIAGLTPAQALAVAVVTRSGDESTDEKPEPEPPWQPETRWIYMFGANGEIIVDGSFEYQEYVPENEPFELRLRMYQTQATTMNKTVENGGDSRCPCIVRHGGIGNGI